MNAREMPIFVKLDEYKDVLDILAMIKTKIGESKIILDKINDLKSEEENALGVWRHEIEEIERTVDSVDKMLFEPEYQ
jgi:hypothetical protein